MAIVEKSYRKLIIWQKFKDLLILTYELVEKLPKSEEFGLKSQMKRAIVSVLSNFAEGYLKASKKDKLRFLEISETSLLELEAQSEICLILSFWSETDFSKFEQKKSLAAYFLHHYKAKIK